MFLVCQSNPSKTLNNWDTEKEGEDRGILTICSTAINCSGFQSTNGQCSLPLPRRLHAYTKHTTSRHENTLQECPGPLGVELRHFNPGRRDDTSSAAPSSAHPAPCHATYNPSPSGIPGRRWQWREIKGDLLDCHVSMPSLIV